MPLDPQAKAFLDQLTAAGAPPLNALPVAEGRQALRTLFSTDTLEPIQQVENRRVPGPAGLIPVRMYVPKGKEPLPVLVYFHGGGWVLGDLETHDGICRSLANAA